LLPFPALDGFLAYESSIPKALLDTGGPRTGKMDINNTIGHFELVNYQLKEVRTMQSNRLSCIMQSCLCGCMCWARRA
jgi:hypothetical protein